jgi:23S rRNA (guanosine2251-2'-O)-methyltransferase
MNLICGINPVLEALGSGTRHFDRLLIAKGLRNRRIAEAISRASRLSIPLRFETRETLDRIAAGVPHQGLVAVVSPRPASTLPDLLEHARNPALFVVLDGVEDPRNLGAILRTAEAVGTDGVLLPDRHNAGLSETVNRASAGALEHVRLARIGNVAQAIETLKSRGVWVVGFDAAGSERWDAVDYRRSVAVVLGGEGKGIRRLVRDHCDHLVSLPLFGHVSSLNVSVAGGIALYEVVRQRGSVPSQVKPIPVRAAPVPEIVGPEADDEEQDPGAPAFSAATVEQDELEDDLADVRMVGLHDEEAAWTGPTLLKPVGFRRGQPRPAGRHKGKPQGHGDRPGRSEGALGPGGGGQGPREGSKAQEAPRAKGGQGRRRRRWPRHGGTPGSPPPARPPSGQGPGGPPGDAETRGPSTEAEASGRGDPRGDAGRHRRRRRRRH